MFQGPHLVFNLGSLTSSDSQSQDKDDQFGCWLPNTCKRGVGVFFPNLRDGRQFKIETLEASQASQIILDNCVGSLVLNTIGMNNS